MVTTAVTCSGVVLVPAVSEFVVNVAITPSSVVFVTTRISSSQEFDSSIPVGMVVETKVAKTSVDVELVVVRLSTTAALTDINDVVCVLKKLSDTAARAVMSNCNPKDEIEPTQPELLHPGWLAFLPFLGSIQPSSVALASRSLQGSFLAAFL